MMEKFESEINKLNEDTEFTTWLSAEEDARKVNNTLIVNAIDEGRRDNQIKAAKKLLSEGMNINKIFDILNVEDKDTKDEIKKISKTIEKDNSYISNEDKIKKETAKKMLEDKIDISLISKYTNLSKDEIIALKNSK